MDTDRLNRWLTLGANIGVLTGLILLVAEIRQNNQIAELQFESDYFSAQEQLDQLMVSADLAEAWSKSVLDPGSLSPSEIKILDSFLATRLSVWRRSFEAELRGFFDAGRTEQSIRGAGSIWFGSAFAQTWWTYEKRNGYVGAGDEFGEMVDEILTGLSPRANAEWIENFQNDIREF